MRVRQIAEETWLKTQVVGVTEDGMTKSELIQQLCTQYKGKGSPAVSCADMREAVDRILEMLADALAVGERIELRGFASFCLHDISARQGRNPRTGESVPVPPRKAVHFRAGVELRALVNNG
jgi:integration host factor subunit beta